MLKFLLFLLIAVVVVMGMPFIGFGKNLDAVCKDAARYFGIDEDEYEVRFVKRVVSATTGENVNGTFNIDFEKGVYSIRVQKSFSRPFTIGVIFHEFAHAAQHKFNMEDRGDFGKYTREQHAELLAFKMLWSTGYWWNGLHMLFMHSFRAKPKEYLAAGPIWSNALTGASAVSLNIN